MNREIDVDKLIETIKQQENIAWQKTQGLDANDDLQRYWYNMGKHSVLQGILMCIDHGLYDKKEE